MLNLPLLRTQWIILDPLSIRILDCTPKLHSSDIWGAITNNLNILGIRTWLFSFRVTKRLQTPICAWINMNTGSPWLAPEKNILPNIEKLINSVKTFDWQISSFFFFKGWQLGNPTKHLLTFDSPNFWTAKKEVTYRERLDWLKCISSSQCNADFKFHSFYVRLLLICEALSSLTTIAWKTKTQRAKEISHSSLGQTADLKR